MNRMTQLRKVFTVFLLAVVLLTGTAFSIMTPNALADDSREANEISNLKGDSSNVNRSYHALQEAAHDFQQDFRADITTGQRSPSLDRNNSPKKAAKNIGEKTRGAFGRAADAVKDTLSPD